MIRAALFATVVTVALVFLCLPAGAQTLLFSDDLENGSSNWHTYPGCFPQGYVSTSNMYSANCNHTPGGSHGLTMWNSTDRDYHDVNLGTYAGGVEFSAWLYDSMTPYSLEAVDIRNASVSQVLGFGAEFGTNQWMVRMITAADGSNVSNGGYFVTSVARSVGWHHLVIDQYRGVGAGVVDWYIDGALAYHTTDAYDTTLNRIVLGNGWNGYEASQGFVDDISFSSVPEPSCLIALAAGILCIPALSRKRRRI